MLKRERIIAFTELDENINDDSIDAESVVISIETYGQVLSVVESLDDKYKDVLRLKYFIGLRDNEIADVLEITPENVRARLHRARKMVKKLIRETGYVGSVE